MKNIDKNESLLKLELDKKILEKLEKENIKTINDLWKMTRKELKLLNFTDSEVNHIRIKLQLRGLDLSKKMYI